MKRTFFEDIGYEKKGGYQFCYIIPDDDLLIITLFNDDPKWVRRFTFPDISFRDVYAYENPSS
jgi:hypothetical protein